MADQATKWVSRTKNPNPTALAFILSVNLSLFKPQNLAMNLERGEEWGFHVDAGHLDGDHYQTTKQG